MYKDMLKIQIVDYLILLFCISWKILVILMYLPNLFIGLGSKDYFNVYYNRCYFYIYLT